MSPSWPNTPTTAPTTTNSHRNSNVARNHTAYSGAAIHAAMRPAIPPAQVLLGLTAGASFLQPIVTPASIAAVSQIQVSTSGRNVSHVALSGSLTVGVYRKPSNA